MTTTEPIIPRVRTQPLPIALDGDLIIDFRNRDPADAEAFLNYPSGVMGKLTIYTDLKTADTTRIVVPATPSTYHCVIKVDAEELNGVKNGTLWSFRLIYPDADLADGYDKVIVNGKVERTDGAA